MNLSQFFEQFPDETSCIEAFKTKKLQLGVVCKKCQHTEHYFRKGDLKFECKKCKSRQSLRSGTVMEHSNLPFRYWMICIELMTLTKKGFSALEMQRLIGHKRYEPIWYMMHKIRRIMGKRDDSYELSGHLEIDEGFFERVDNKVDNPQNEDAIETAATGGAVKNKRGRGSEKQAKVLVMVESKPVDDPQSKHKPNRKAGYIKMKVMGNLKSESIIEVVKESVNKAATIQSDGYRGYTKLKEVIAQHQVIVEPDKKNAEKMFPWVNRAISNAKKIMLGIHHNVINDKYVQNYLDEFCYKFNRRYFGENLSERLVSVALTTTWY